MKTKIDITSCGKSDIGKMRGNNEDANIVETFGEDDRYLLAAAIDGVGGYEGGEFAAQIVRDTLIDHVKACVSSLESSPEEVLKAALESANGKVLARQLSTPDLHDMGAVCTAALFDRTQAMVSIAHIGDTRAYLFADGVLTKLTRDHSPVGSLEDSGQLTESAAMNHPRRNVISRMIGMPHGVDEAFIDSFKTAYSVPAVFLLCSDGLTDLVDSQFLLSVLSDTSASPESKADRLIAEANRISGKDNITAVVIECHAAPEPEHEGAHVAMEVEDIITLENEKDLGRPTKHRTGVSRTIFFLSMVICLLAGFIAGYLASELRFSYTGVNRSEPVDSVEIPGYVPLSPDSISSIPTVRDTLTSQNENQ